MKTCKRIISAVICMILLIGPVAAGGCFSRLSDTFSIRAAADPTYSTGDIIEYGSYPQSEVTDSSLIRKLNSLSSTWISYGYGVDMNYCDVVYNSVKYRGVKFSEYRSSQNNNSKYLVNNIYWFKYEPIKWRLADPSTGLVICTSVLDAQAFTNSYYEKNDKYYTDATCTSYANKYDTSSVRKWLNNTFLNTAFSSGEQAGIIDDAIDNSSFITVVSSFTKTSEFDSLPTRDKVFLPSLLDFLDYSYGYDPFDGGDGFCLSSARFAYSDYSLCSGFSLDNFGGGEFWLRSTNESYHNNSGLFGCSCNLRNWISHEKPHKYVYQTYCGVLPSIRISSLIVEPERYVLTFNPNDEAFFSPIRQSGRGPVKIIKDKVLSHDPTDKSFVGWATTKNATVPEYQPGDTINLTRNTTLYAVYNHEGLYKPEVSIINNPLTKAINVSYGTTLILQAKMERYSDYNEICWFVSDADGNNVEAVKIGSTCELKLYESSIILAAPVYFENGKYEAYTDEDGNMICDYEYVTVKSNFFIRLIALFRALFGLLPIVKQ